MSSKKNRLNLDWALNSATERSAFVEQYLNEFYEKFRTAPTEEELETIANYVLWGKDEDGLSPSEKGEIEIETKNKTWTRDNVDSLDEMMESPTFNEASLQCHPAPTRITQEKFSRSRALKECPESMRPTFEALFRQIDEIDLSINFYEILHGKRQKPPREELCNAFTEAEKENLRERVSHWNQFAYLKRRHLLVELRREQFALRDSYIQPIVRQSPPEPIAPEDPLEFDSDIPVFPAGLFNEQPIAALLFREKKDLCFAAFDEQQLSKISRWLWERKDIEKEVKARRGIYFDFCDLENVYGLFQELCELEDGQELSENTEFLVRTLRFYIEFAELSEAQREILDLKIKKVKNQDIADFVNRKYGKSYTANYISTIFRQKIIPKINEGAAFHQKILENLFFEEEFKKCSVCGIWMLRDAENFVKKTRAKDGLANRCKKCDKLDRLRKKKVEVDV